MPFYHATWERHLNSIHRHGLGGALSDTRNFDCEPGLYLARDPFVALSFLMEAMIENADRSSSPKEILATVRIIVIDDSRVDEKFFDIDPEIERRDLTLMYQGMIDVRGMPVLTIDDLVPDTDGSPEEPVNTLQCP